MELTKKKALEICLELWGWMAKTGRVKRAWLGWKKYGEMENQCSCCEYVKQTKKVTRSKGICSGDPECSVCPMRNLWGKFCCSDESPYELWYTDRKKYAKIIANAARKELKKLAQR